jgi:hypothetical protein
MQMIWNPTLHWLNTTLAIFDILADIKFKAYMEHKAGELSQLEAYGFVAREGEEDEEAPAPTE